MPATLKTSADEAELVYVRRRPHEPAVYEELSEVVLLADARTIEGNLLVAAGSAGTVVVVHDDGRAYDVEFDEPAGVVAVLAANLRSL